MIHLYLIKLALSITYSIPSKMLSHEEGVPYLAGENPLIKYGINAEPVKVDRALHDGDKLPFGGGLTVVPPGHTPEHMRMWKP